jgi:prophage antirepressor-like protein
MTDDLQLFTFETQTVRTVLVNGEPWFVAKDVTDILGYTNGRMATGALPDRMKSSVTISDGTPGNPSRAAVSESGVYRLVMRSNLPAAERFQDWLAEEVIPQIRRTGSYGVRKELTRVEMAEMLLEAEKAREKLAIDLRVAEAQKLALAAGRREDAPKVASYEMLMEADGAVSVNAAAKILNMPGIGQNNFFGLLREYGMIIPGKRVPYQKYIDQGWFTVRAGAWGKPTTDGHEWAEVTRVTAKGLDRLARFFKAKEPLEAVPE